MVRNELRALWDAGKPALNGWLSIDSAFVAEIMACQGYDALTVDLQHGALDYSALVPMLQAMRGRGPALLARVPWLDAGAVMKVLDAGVLGVICPMINSADEAAEFASYMRYPPLGQRSFGPTRAVFAMPGYSEADANREVLALAMIETAAGMENIEAIARTPGIDGIYVGPADLTLGTQNGRLPAGMDRTEPEMLELIQRIPKVCAAAGIRCCLHTGAPDYAAKAIGWGYNMTTISADTRLLAGAAKASVDAWRALTGMVSD